MTKMNQSTCSEFEHHVCYTGDYQFQELWKANALTNKTIWLQPPAVLLNITTCHNHLIWCNVWCILTWQFNKINVLWTVELQLRMSRTLGDAVCFNDIFDLLGYSYEHVKTLQRVATTTFLSNLFDECSFFLIWSWSWLRIRRICMLDALLFQFPNRSKSTSNITKASGSIFGPPTMAAVCF